MRPRRSAPSSGRIMLRVVCGRGAMKLGRMLRPYTARSLAIPGSTRSAMRPKRVDRPWLSARGAPAIVGLVSDERLRGLERTWRRTGAQADLEALLRERLRAGTLTRERLHLAAWVGDPAARAVYEPPSEAELNRLVAPTCFDGVETLVETEWVELLHQWTPAEWEWSPVFMKTIRTLQAARAHPVLGKLRPYTSMASVGLSRCMESWSNRTSVWIHPRDANGFTVGTYEAEKQPNARSVGRAIELAAQRMPSGGRVWRGDPNALLCERVRHGALDDSPAHEERLEALGGLGARPLVRAIRALLGAGLKVSRSPTRVPVKTLVGCLDRWCARPDPATAAAVHRAVADVEQNEGTWLTQLALQAGPALDGTPPPRYLLQGRWERFGDERLRALVRDAVAPWALGLGDPIVEAAPR
jgi:hypothetical protein